VDRAVAVVLKRAQPQRHRFSALLRCSAVAGRAGGTFWCRKLSCVDEPSRSALSRIELVR
jgi:hypothetical protein